MNICRVARSIHKKRGVPTSRAIQLAIGTMRNWASGQKNVDADTRAKAVKAMAEWTALKAASKGKKVKKMATSNTQSELVALCQPSFNVENVREAWAQTRSKEMYPHLPKDPDGYVRGGWIEQLWSDFVIVCGDLEGDKQQHYYKVAFDVDPATKEIEFGEPVEVKQSWEVVNEDYDFDPSELDDEYAAASNPVNKFASLSLETNKDFITKFAK